MRMKFLVLAAASGLACTSPAMAKAGDPVAVSDNATFDPMLAVRLRYESVSQDNPVQDADAVTARIRFGGEFKTGGLALLAEGEGTLALVDDYFDTIDHKVGYSTVADPENIELNRLQLAYKKDGSGLTVGRQRIILDNARFVGNVGWRQNEQTFDAIRGEAKVGPLKLDATYAISQRTIFGTDSPNEYFDGDLVLLNVGADLKAVKLSAFAYLIDYDTRLAFSSKTFGASASGSLPVGPGISINAAASFAVQSDMGGNPTPYDAEYYNIEAGVSVAGFSLKGGYEELGSDGGVASFQTPLATLHAFNGWADVFLTTPPEGLRDYYVSAGYSLSAIPGLPALKLGATYHKFEADIGGADFGEEFDISLGTKIGPVALLAKYAAYNADTVGVDTDKFWLQAEFSF